MFFINARRKQKFITNKWETLLHLWSNYGTILGILIVFPIIYLLRTMKNKDVKGASKFLQQIMLTISIEGQYDQNPKTELSSMKNDAHSKKCEIVPYKPFTGRSSMQSKNGKVQ
jgi:hypothetical protein